MASKGARDFVARFLTDLSKFDAGEAAEQLEDVAGQADDTDRSLADLERAAGDASRDVERLGRDAADAGRGVRDVGEDAERAGDDVKRFGGDTDRTARDVDDALDRIRRASKQSFGGIGDDAKKGTAGFKDVADEAQDTSREMAASFRGGADDVADALQEMSANALAALGPIGAAAGIAAAIGLGALKSQLEGAAEEANAAKDRMIELAQEIDDAGGTLDGIDLEGKIRDWSLEIEDNRSWWELWQKENLTRFEVLERKAGDLGLSFSDLLRGMSGADPDAAARSWQELTDVIADYDEKIRRAAESTTVQDAAYRHRVQNLQGERAQYTKLRDELEASSGVSARALDLQQRLAAAIGSTAAERERLAEAEENYAGALGEFIDPLSTYTELLADKQAAEQENAEALAEATGRQAGAWEDFTADVQVSVAEYLAALREQVEAQESWHRNMVDLADRVSADTLDELAKLGPEGAPLVAELVDASAAELAELDSLFARRTASATGAAVDQLRAARGDATAAGGAFGAAVGQGMVGGLRDYSDQLRAEAAAVIEQIQRDANGTPITIKTRLDPTGATTGLKTLVRGERVRV